ETDRRGEERCDEQGTPEADERHQRISQIRADREKSAVSEVDYPAQIQNQREAKRHQCVKGADDQAVEDVEQQYLRHGAFLSLCAEFRIPAAGGVSRQRVGRATRSTPPAPDDVDACRLSLP